MLITITITFHNNRIYMYYLLASKATFSGFKTITRKLLVMWLRIGYLIITYLGGLKDTYIVLNKY